MKTMLWLELEVTALEHGVTKVCKASIDRVTTLVQRAHDEVAKDTSEDMSKLQALKDRLADLQRLEAALARLRKP